MPDREASRVTGHGFVVASRRVWEDHERVGFMYHEPAGEGDSGVAVPGGDESPGYLADPGNLVVCGIQSVLRLDPAVGSYVDAPVGTAFTPGG